MSLEGRHRFAQACPTFLENWPVALQALSIAQEDLALDLAEARALGSNIRHFGHWFGPGPPLNLDSLALRLASALRRFPAGAFVRLGSRSGKDSDLAIAGGQRVHDAAAALRLLTDGSERIASDLRQCIARGYAPHLFVREWQPIAPWSELRCFMRQRRLVGICQYDCINLGPSPQLAALAPRVPPVIEQFFVDFRRAVHLDDVVFDVFLQTDVEAPRRLSPRLLEINPFGPQTDAVLFDWRAAGGRGDFDGGFRYLR